MKELKVGDSWGKGRYKKEIREIKILSNGWCLIKTANSKSEKDFLVKVIFSLKPPRSMTPKHAHFLIDFYGKWCANKEKASLVLEAIYRTWQRKKVEEILKDYDEQVKNLPGYPLEYILYALEWILEQEDLNFKGRPEKKQNELNEICERQGIRVPEGRQGSQLAIALFCEVASGTHPVEALLKANLDIRPKNK
ncbi:MAG: hypothetical protein RMI74_07255 [Thermodesulfobacterium sp.]|nr:hypothetical protein [Thermodesulfobacterium sp.]